MKRRFVEAEARAVVCVLCKEQFVGNPRDVREWRMRHECVTPPVERGDATAPHYWVGEHGMATGGNVASPDDLCGTCGHPKAWHIYHEGACRGGFVCPIGCEEYTAPPVEDGDDA